MNHNNIKVNRSFYRYDKQQSLYSIYAISLCSNCKVRVRNSFLQPRGLVISPVLIRLRATSTVQASGLSEIGRVEWQNFRPLVGDSMANSSRHIAKGKVWTVFLWTKILLHFARIHNYNCIYFIFVYISKSF